MVEAIALGTKKSIVNMMFRYQSYVLIEIIDHFIYKRPCVYNIDLIC